LGILKKVKRFAGSSSGSMLSAFAAVRMFPSDLEQRFLDFDMSSLRDDSFGVLRDANRFIDQYGFYKGDVLENWIEQTLYEVTGINHITFKQVLEKYDSDLYITRVNLSRVCTEYLCAEYTPDMPISEAVRQSASIPFVFKAPLTPCGDVIVDGGLGNAYPIDIFDPADNTWTDKTIGLKIMVPGLEKRNATIRTELGYEITDIFKFIDAVITFQTVLVERMAANAGYWERTITLDSPNRSIHNFDVSREDKLTEVSRGMINTTSALAKFIDVGHF
jgi:predicted acylesterase/phospholipase RssA